MKKQKRNEGFTLVELIIVIIILGILAALAIPQFVTSTEEAKDATLKANLAVLRNAINLYYHQHNSIYPGAVKETDGTAVGSNAEAATALLAQLMEYSDEDGETDTVLDRTTYPFGPYLMGGFPANPLAVTGVGQTSVLADFDEDAPLVGEGNPTTAWIYSPMTGEIRANDQAYDHY